MSERVCPECGCDTWKAAVYDEQHRALQSWRRQARDLSLENLALKVEVEKWKRRDQERSGKVRRQTRVIRRLEKALREGGVFPYAGAKLDETPAVAETSLLPDPDADGALERHGPILSRRRRRRAEKKDGA